MQYTLDADAISALSVEQRRAILKAMYLVLAVDRQVEGAEKDELEVEVKKVPWGIDTQTIHGYLVETRDRVLRTKAREDWIAWVQELAQQIPATVHVPVLATMARLAKVSDISQNERGLLNLFAMTFGITQPVADQIKASLS